MEAIGVTQAVGQGHLRDGALIRSELGDGEGLGHQEDAVAG
jgi:hypothetical protein